MGIFLVKKINIGKVPILATLTPGYQINCPKFLKLLKITIFDMGLQKNYILDRHTKSRFFSLGNFLRQLHLKSKVDAYSLKYIFTMD